MSKPIWIVGAKRTPQGKFLGALSRRTAVELAVAAGRGALGNVDPALVDSVIVGNVLGAGLGMNISRQIGLHLGLPITTPAFTVNMMCLSGLQAVMLGAQAIQTGTSRLVLCGGTESMSRAPYLVNRIRTGLKFGNAELVDSLISDGLTDPTGQEHMALTAERVAERYQISREAQDQFALASQQRYAAALQAGHFENEIVPVDGITTDEQPRPDSTLEGLAKLKPSFSPTGTVTAGNASGLNDGAAMLLLCDAETGEKLKLEPMMIIRETALVGCDPAVMGLGPVHAVRKIGRPVDDYDVIELNEAFAAQSLGCVRELHLDEAKVNPHGGAISLGHPLGASGARLLVHLANHRPQRGLATLCAGGGMGGAVVVERP
ncbi:thiolase family protein [Planctomicrobium sp. SH661]|uniref:thiolase family protein n=1 Tax=Planctomicrobium sp. SH661 TaxID=3448124 RepID=UPI003F5C4517